jgi:hypothetical protein
MAARSTFILFSCLGKSTSTQLLTTYLLHIRSLIYSLAYSCDVMCLFSCLSYVNIALQNMMVAVKTAKYSELRLLNAANNMSMSKFTSNSNIQIQTHNNSKNASAIMYVFIYMVIIITLSHNTGSKSKSWPRVRGY